MNAYSLAILLLAAPSLRADLTRAHSEPNLEEALQPGPR